LSVGLLGPALSELRDRVGTDIGGIGILFVAQWLGYVVGSVAGGRWYDRRPGHRVFAVALALMASGLVLLPFVSSLSGLFAAFVLIGFGAATADVGGNTLLMWQLGAAGGRAVNLLHLCFGIGALSAPLLVSAGSTVAAITGAVLALCVAGWVVTIPSPEVSTVDREDHATTSRPQLALMATFFLLYVGLEVGFGGWIHTYAEEIDLGAAGATWLTTTFWIGFTSGRVLSSAIARRIRPRSVLATSCGLTIATALALIVGNGRPVAVWVGTALIGMSMAPLFPVMLVYLERRIRVTGSATAWFVGAAGVGGLIFPWLIGRWFDASGAATLPWSMLVLAVATAISFAATDRRLARRAGAGQDAPSASSVSI
ncbi:MAG: MFS transporter, partial [Ilumatobacteraceae bacterium]